jgi:hypothetical protein
VIPTLAQLPGKPKRIILHWTGGTYHVGLSDRRSYHYVIDGDGLPHEGVPVHWNMRPTASTLNYAAHTRMMNSFSVGIAFAGMFGAHERGPYGKWPLTQEQVMGGCYFVGQLCREWELDVTPDTVHTHAEADWRHGVQAEREMGYQRVAVGPQSQPRGSERTAAALGPNGQDNAGRYVAESCTNAATAEAITRRTDGGWGDVHAGGAAFYRCIRGEV